MLFVLNSEKLNEFEVQYEEEFKATAKILSVTYAGPRHCQLCYHYRLGYEFINKKVPGALHYTGLSTYKSFRVSSKDERFSTGPRENGIRFSSENLRFKVIQD